MWWLMVAFRRNRLEERQLWRISIWRCLACALQCHPPRRIIKRLCLQGKWRSWGMPSRCLLQTWPPMTSQSWQNVKNVLWEGWTGVNAVIEGQASGLCRGVVYYCELFPYLFLSLRDREDNVLFLLLHWMLYQLAGQFPSRSDPL